MKHIIAAIVLSALLLLLPSCGSEPVDPLSPTINNQSQEDSSPTSDLLRTDLQQSLTAWRNENAYYYVEFREFEIIKSITNDNVYSAQISVAANSKYAEHHFTADVIYTLYDQGWIIDSCQWTVGEYSVIAYPTQEELIQFPDGNILLGATNLEFVNEGFITYVSFTKTFEWGPYATGEESFTTEWCYDPACDQWTRLNTYTNKISPSLSSSLFDILPTNEHYFTYEIRNQDEAGFDIRIKDDRVRTDWIRVEFSTVYIDSPDTFMRITLANNDIEFYEKTYSRTNPGMLEVTIEVHQDIRNLGNEQYNISFDYFVINYGSYGSDGYTNYAHDLVDLNNSTS